MSTDNNSEDGDARDSRALQVPLLVAGLPGTGKTSELAAQALAHTWQDLASGAPPRRTLCLAAHNSAVTVLRAKMTKGARMLDQCVLEAFRREHGDHAGDYAAARQHCILTPSQQPDWLSPQFDTIHHACRRWLTKYGTLIGQNNMGDVCSEKRALLILDTLQSEVAFDFFDERGGVGLLAVQGEQESASLQSRATRATLRDSLSIVPPDEPFLRAAVHCARRCRQLQVTAGMLQEIISQVKTNAFRVSEELRERYDESALEAAVEMREYYDTLLRHNKLYDFDDLVVYGLQLVQGFAQHIIEEEKIGMILLDDMHNTSLSQRQFVRALVGESGTNGRLVVACEEMRLSPSYHDTEPSDMSTYRFSGAPSHVDSHDLMQECLPAGQGYAPIAMTRNTRNTPMIEHVAYEMIEHHVLDNRALGGAQKTPYLCAFASIREEAQFVCDEADRLYIDDDANGREPSSLAIITRRNEDIRFLVDELVDLGRPIRVMGQENGDLSSDEALDLVSFLAAAHNPALHHLVDRALVVFRRCFNQPLLTINDLPDADVILAYLGDGEGSGPRPAVSDDAKPFLDVLRAVSREGRDVGATLRDLIDILHYKERYLADGGDGNVGPVRHSTGTRWECVQALIRRANDFDDRFCTGHSGQRTDMFLRECHAYASDRLAYRRSRPETEITLLTMHYAQAMEFDVVFVSGLEHDSMPRGRRMHAEVLEERKLLFLTILRARQRVYFHYLDKAYANAARANRAGFDGQEQDALNDVPLRRPYPPSFRRPSPGAAHQRSPGGHSVFLSPILMLLQRRW